jgi:hypothetical protein
MVTVPPAPEQNSPLRQQPEGAMQYHPDAQHPPSMQIADSQKIFEDKVIAISPPQHDPVAP